METARTLARMGATVVMACRNKQKAQPILEEIMEQTGNKNVFLMNLDLADLKSVRAFANEFKSKFDKLDILINNAGVSQLE